MLPDDALLEINFRCLDNAVIIDWWHPLVYVCRRWWAIVFASPGLANSLHRKTPVREMLSIWPTLLIVISGRGNLVEDVGNIIAALIVLCDHFIEITLFRKANVDPHHINRISCTGPDWQLESLTQVCNSILPPLSSLRIIDDLHHQPLWQDMENTQWLEFLRQFATVKLYLSEQFTLRVGAALPELTSKKGVNVLPRLQLLFLTARNWERSRPVWDAFKQFM